MDPQRRFDQLFRAHIGAVRRYAAHRSIVGDEAEDLVAETFLVAWRRIDAVPPDDALPWLLTTAANLRRNQLRRVIRHRARNRLVAALDLKRADVGEHVTGDGTPNHAPAGGTVHG